MESEIYKKEFTVGEIFNESWNRFLESFYDIVKIILLFFSPIIIASTFLSYQEESYFQANDVLSFGMFILFLVGILLAFFPMMIIAFLVKDRIDGKPVEKIGTYFERALFKIFHLFITNILMAFGLFFLFLMFVIPAVIFAVYWSFAFLAIILKDKKYLSALDYSKEMVKGRWWKVFGYLVFFGIAGFIVEFVFMFPLAALSEFLTQSISSESGFVFAVIVSLFDVLISMFFFIISIVFFLNFDTNRAKVITAESEVVE